MVAMIELGSSLSWDASALLTLQRKDGIDETLLTTSTFVECHTSVDGVLDKANMVLLIQPCQPVLPAWVVSCQHDSCLDGYTTWAQTHV